MYNDLIERVQITSLEEFIKLCDKGHTDYSNYDFMFPFGFSSSELLIKKLEDTSYNFSGSVFSESIWFTKGNTPDGKFEKIRIDKPVKLLGITFKKFVIFDHLEFIGTLRIESCTFHDIEFLSSPIKELILINNKFLGKFKISQHDIQQSDDRVNGKDVEKIKIEELTFINNTIATETIIRFGYLDVTIFRFRDIYNPINSEINIGECNFNNLDLCNVRNSGRLRIYGININKEECKVLILINSSLGDSEFYNVNLKCYRESFVANNLLSGLKYTGVQWPDELETEEPSSIQKKRETYRNLKIVALENNDAPQALVFYAKEMETYSRTLSWKKGERIDKCILWFNRKTNNFGLSWVRPIGWIFGFGIVLYGLLLWSLCLDIGHWDNWTKFPVFLIPTHKAGTEFIAGQWGLLAYSIDLVFRLIETTLIYQTIVAFRKFTRKL